MYGMIKKQELAQYYSDYHKDIFGFRPHIDMEPYTEAEVCDKISELDDYMLMVERDPILRKQFEADGWAF